jgi:hypothetical protein
MKENQPYRVLRGPLYCAGAHSEAVESSDRMRRKTSLTLSSMLQPMGPLIKVKNGGADQRQEARTHPITAISN